MKTSGLSLRIKATLTLTVCTLLATLLVGLLAKEMVYRKFSEEAMNRAFSNFSADVTHFISRHGSWEAGAKAQGFRNYVVETRMHRPAPNPLMAGPVPPPGQLPPPPFRFVLTDLQGIVIHGSESYPVGQPLDDRYLTQAMPILQNREPVVIAYPLGQPNLSEMDLFYLHTVDRALIYAMVISGILAVLLGIIFGNRISASLRLLTEEIGRVKPGEIRKDIVISSKDEVAVLADTFNKISHHLADAYEELEQAHQQVTKQAEQLLELSIKDELTGLYNRRHFREQASQYFKQAKRYQTPLSVMLADIDFFKRINDQFGHATGDIVLREVATIMQSNLRESDLLARYGGEEFVVIFPKTDLTDAIELCERLRNAIESFTWHTIEPELKVTLSIGLDADTSLQQFDELLVKADEKLYLAKDRGRNQVISAD